MLNQVLQFADTSITVLDLPVYFSEAPAPTVREMYCA